MTKKPSEPKREPRTTDYFPEVKQKGKHPWSAELERRNRDKTSKKR